MMLLQYFKKKENQDKDIANSLYLQIIEIIKNTILNNKLIIKNDFNSSFEISSIILFVFFNIVKNNKDYKLVNQELMNIFIKDLDYSLRKNGISDIKIGKYVKSYVKKFYFRVDKLQGIFDTGDEVDFNLFIRNMDFLIDNKSKLSDKFLNNFYKNLLFLLRNYKEINYKNISITKYFN